jgi:hypothetical protein
VRNGNYAFVAPENLYLPPSPSKLATTFAQFLAVPGSRVRLLTGPQGAQLLVGRRKGRVRLVRAGRAGGLDGRSPLPEAIGDSGAHFNLVAEQRIAVAGFAHRRAAVDSTDRGCHLSFPWPSGSW